MEKTENKKLFNIFFATTVGVCIGFVLIKEYFTDISIWLSLVGGLIGAGSAYILNDWRGALSGIADAWKLTKHEAPKILLIIGEAMGKALWKIIKFPFIKSHMSMADVFYLTLGVSSSLATAIMYSYILLLTLQQIRTDELNVVMVCSIWMSVTWAFFTIAGLLAFEEDAWCPDTSCHKKIAFWSLPIVHLPYLLFLLLINLPKLVKFTAVIALEFILLIHTTDRLISAVDAFIFAMLAYGVGVLGDSWVAESIGIHLAIFATAGGVFGVFNKLYIKPLLEKWALRLKPALTTEE